MMQGEGKGGKGDGEVLWTFTLIGAPRTQWRSQPLHAPLDPTSVVTPRRPQIQICCVYVVVVVCVPPAMDVLLAKYGTLKWGVIYVGISRLRRLLPGRTHSLGPRADCTNDSLAPSRPATDRRLLRSGLSISRCTHAQADHTHMQINF
jgi:hypothetical protein